MVSLNEIGTEPEKPKQCPCKCGKGIVAILVLFLLAGVACWYIHHPNRPRYNNPEMDLKPGTVCTVYFRSDSLGETANLPVSQTPNRINETQVFLHGELIAINREAILLRCPIYHYPNNEEVGVSTVEQFWIPRNNILFINHYSLTLK